MPIDSSSLSSPDTESLADIPYATCAALSRAFRDRQLSPIDVATALLDRIEQLDPYVNAFVFVDRASTLASAARSEKRWRRQMPLSALDGIPVTIKDLIAVADWPLVRGSLALVGTAPPAQDAPAVARLREAGAVFLGKTATPEAGCKIVTRSPVHGVTLNPYDLARTPGGSSGGAAAALALGIGPLALGSDGAGSIRIPAAWNGVFGLKPSFGRVPIYPPSVFMPHSVVGPMARDVESARLMLEVISQPDSRDPYALMYPFDAEAALQPVAGLRIGVTRDFGTVSPPIDPDILAAVTAAATRLELAGATVDEVKPQWPCDPYDPFMVLWEATYAGFLRNSYSVEAIAKMDPDLQAIAERGMTIDMVQYHKALIQRVALAAHSKSIFTQFDLLLGPVMPCGPPGVAHDAPVGCTPGDWRWCPFTYLWNMTGQPAASVPWTSGQNGLPIGVQFVAGVGREADIFRAARALQSASQLMPKPSALLERAAQRESESLK
jgi:aspartyl-tRNA(Asn)/glutamyl-tRNA(Gln) amidotransferase subunit A